MSVKDQDYSKDLGLNAEYLNSILQKLSRLDEEIANLKDNYRVCKESESNTKARKDELDAEINTEVDTIRKELNAKLIEMLDSLKEHQSTQQAEALRIQQEISTLKKEKLDLYQKINELQKRITDMEMTIGQDANVIAN